MLRIRDIMSRDVLVLSPETSVREAIVTLAERRVTGAPVVVGTRVVGVLSTSDIMEFQADEPALPSGRGAEPGPATDEYVPAEWEGENEPGGTFFTELWWDAGAELQERFAAAETAEWDPMAGHTVAEAMSRRVRALRPDATVDAAAALMARTGAHRVLVMDGHDLLGIVTTMDVTRAVAEHRLESRRYVFGHPRR
jgi:CBS domain-containing protein